MSQSIEVASRMPVIAMKGLARMKGAVMLAIGVFTLGAVPARGQVPYFELQGSINGAEASRTWYSANGILDANTGTSGQALNHFSLSADQERAKVRFSYKCEADGVAQAQEWGNERCPAVQGEPSSGIKRFKIRLVGEEAEQYELAYSCWVAQEGYTPQDRGVRSGGEWCGVADSDEKVRVTRLVLSVKRRSKQALETPAITESRSADAERE